jgi:hypothetical protein
VLLIRTSLHPSPIHGVGVFTNKPIPKGQVVWVFDARIDLSVPLEEKPNFPPAIQEFLYHLIYVEIMDGRKMMILCADNAKYMNHSNQPNQPNLLDTEDNLREYAARYCRRRRVDLQLPCLRPVR